MRRNEQRRLILLHLPYLLRRSLLASIDDGLFSVAKGAAYSALLSFFPVLTSVATIFVQVRADYVQQSMAEFLRQILPPGTQTTVLQQFRYHGQRPIGLLVLAFSLSLWAASSVVKSLIDGFNAAYRVPVNRSALAHIGMGIMLVIFAGIPLLGASSLILFGGAIQMWVLDLLKVDPLVTPLAGWWKIFSQAMRYTVAFAATASLTAIMYYYGPYRRQRWRAVWPGALVATVLWLLATVIFGWYVRNITNYNLLYGSVGTSIALLSWMYIVAIIALYGCEFNAEAERMIGALRAQHQPAQGAAAPPSRLTQNAV